MQPVNPQSMLPVRLDALIADPQRQPEARAALAAEIAQSPSTLSYVKWARAVPETLPVRRVALLTSYTFETAAPFLAVEAYLSGWRIAPSFLQYTRWQPALLDPAKELSEHDAAVLLLDDASLFAQLGATAGEASAAIAAMLEGFRSRSRLPLFIGLVPVRPAPSAFGLGWSERGKELAVVQAVNATLAGFCERDRATHLIDIPGALAACGAAWHQAESFTANMSYVSHHGMPALAREIARSIGGMLVPRKKVLVTDLDDTLWGGILGEEGPDRIAVGGHYAAYQAFLKRLRASGVLLAIVSKNNEADVREAFEKRAKDIPLALDDFSAAKISWGDKSEAIRLIADELSLGLDSFVFVDDSPVECERVRQALPMVTTIATPPRAAGMVERILASRAFDTLVISEEDTQRADQYRAERERQAVGAGSSDLPAFLRSLDLKVSIRPFEDANANRVHQLLLKTNQYHLTLERPSLGTLSERVRAGNELYAVSLIDRFGDYGIIAIAEFETQDNDLLIRNVAISCRALGRQVEETILALAEDRAKSRKIDRLAAKFVVGPRNTMMPEMMQRLGFEQIAAAPDSIGYRYALKPGAPHWPDMVKVDFGNGTANGT
jgi:FkbH-like protein